MTKTMVWAGLALSALLALSGCHKIRKCTIGEDGCLEGSPDDDGNCSAGLELRGGKCVKPSGGGGGDDVCGGCAGDEVCDEDTESCISYCEYEDDPPAKEPTPQGCEAPNATGAVPYTYADVCISLCEQRCLRAQEYCTGFTCNLDECSQAGPERRLPSAAALARCTAACPAPPNLSCITAACEDWRDTACQDFECPNGTTRDCANVRCTDTCASENIQDGFCDDGDPASADYSFCQYGTDCGDCGPRRGTTRPPRAARGELCPAGQDVACDGYNDDYLRSDAWCLRIYVDSSAPSRCVPDCTTATGAGDCPGPDYVCLPAETRDGEAITDVYGTEGYYCQPLVCE